MTRSRRPSPGASAGADLAGHAAMAAVAVLVVAVPLVWSVRASDPFRLPKSALALAAWTCLASVFLLRNLRHRAAWTDPWWWPWLAVVAAGLASAATAPRFLEVLATLLPVALAGLGWGAIRQLAEPQRRRAAALVVWTGAAEAAASLLFLAPGWAPQSFEMLHSGKGRFGLLGTMGNPGDIGVFLVLPALLAAERAVARRRGRAAAAAAALLMAAVVAVSQTITAIVALVAGLAVLAWRHLPRRRRGLAVAAVTALLLAGAVATPLAPRLRTAAGQLRSGDWESLGSWRGASFAAAARMLASHPVTGMGFGQYGANSFRFLSEDTLARRAFKLGLVTGYGEAHNDVLQLGAETGLLGLLLVGGAVVLALRRGKARAGDAPAPGPLLAGAAVLLLGQFPLHLAAVAAQWLVLWALVLPPLPVPEKPAVRVAWMRLAGVVAITAAGTLVAWQEYNLAVAVEQARVLSASVRAAPDPLRGREVARLALMRLERLERWAPWSWQTKLALGNLAVDAGQRNRAVDFFSAAVTLADRPESRFDLGMELLAQGDREAGFTNLVRAVHLNPRILQEVTAPAVRQELRRRLDADGTSARYPWIYAFGPRSGA